MDADGYPDDEELQRIREWAWKDARGCFEFMRERWAYADAGYWHVDPDGIFHLSTAGWSGNEDLMSALRDNLLLWTFCWVSSRRGGHYEFEIPAGLATPTPESSMEGK